MVAENTRGERHGFTANSRYTASIFLNEPCCDGCEERREILSLHGGGQPSSATIAIAAMDFFTVPMITFGVLIAFSSSLMNGGASCTSM